MDYRSVCIAARPPVPCPFAPGFGRPERWPACQDTKSPKRSARAQSTANETRQHRIPLFNVQSLDRGRCLGLPRFNNPCEVTVPRYQARVLVNLRPSVLDPAGEATRSAASRLGVDGVSKLRIGKAVELELDAPDEQEARRRLELLSDRLLANPVIENWTLELQQA